MNIGVIVLSRFNSSRLPGKALKKIYDKPVLQYIVERLLCVVNRNQIVIATSSEQTDDPIAAYAASIDVHVHRGSLENVAQRFVDAGNTYGFDYIVRINGDNIFVDTEVLSQMVAVCQTGKYQFISNVKGRTFPKGMSVEIIKTSFFLESLPAITLSSSYREHVTLFFYEKEQAVNHYYVFNEILPEAAGIQMALDTEEDFVRTTKIISHFDAPHWQYNLEKIYQIWKLIENEKPI